LTFTGRNLPYKPGTSSISSLRDPQHKISGIVSADLQMNITYAMLMPQPTRTSRDFGDTPQEVTRADPSLPLQESATEAGQKTSTNGNPDTTAREQDEWQMVQAKKSRRPAMTRKDNQPHEAMDSPANNSPAFGSAHKGIARTQNLGFHSNMVKKGVMPKDGSSVTPQNRRLGYEHTRVSPPTPNDPASQHQRAQNLQ
jgi:hypothetical protein